MLLRLNSCYDLAHNPRIAGFAASIQWDDQREAPAAKRLEACDRFMDALTAHHIKHFAVLNHVGAPWLHVAALKFRFGVDQQIPLGESGCIRPLRQVTQSRTRRKLLTKKTCWQSHDNRLAAVRTWHQHRIRWQDARVSRIQEVPGFFAERGAYRL